MLSVRSATKSNEEGAFVYQTITLEGNIKIYNAGKNFIMQYLYQTTWKNKLQKDSCHSIIVIALKALG
jgi:hypothetical protein